MAKEVLAVDVDEVLYPFVPTFLDYHNRMHGTAVTHADIRDYSFHETLGITTQQFWERIQQYEAEDDVHVLPIEHAKLAISALSERFELVILTARHKRCAARTGRWIRNHFGDAFQAMYHVGHASGDVKRISKADICRQIGARSLIDDSMKNLADCAQVGIEGVLFGDYPWTIKADLPDGIAYRENWPAVQEYFDV